MNFLHSAATFVSYQNPPSSMIGPLIEKIKEVGPIGFYYFKNIFTQYLYRSTSKKKDGGCISKNLHFFTCLLCEKTWRLEI